MSETILSKISQGERDAAGRLLRAAEALDAVGTVTLAEAAARLRASAGAAVSRLVETERAAYADAESVLSGLLGFGPSLALPMMETEEAIDLTELTGPILLEAPKVKRRRK